MSSRAPPSFEFNPHHRFPQVPVQSGNHRPPANTRGSDDGGRSLGKEPPRGPSPLAFSPRYHFGESLQRAMAERTSKSSSSPDPTSRPRQGRNGANPKTVTRAKAKPPHKNRISKDASREDEEKRRKLHCLKIFKDRDERRGAIYDTGEDIGEKKPSRRVVTECISCQGSGMKTTMRQLGPTIHSSKTMCPDCNGEGGIVRTLNLKAPRPEGVSPRAASRPSSSLRALNKHIEERLGYRASDSLSDINFDLELEGVGAWVNG